MESSGGVNKNYKKRENKRSKKSESEEKPASSQVENIPLKDPLTVLKEKLLEAKEIGDHKLAAKLRQDIWVLQDVNSGVQAEDDDKKIVEESLARISKSSPKEEKPDSSKTELTGDQALSKDMKKLNKKLDQIEKLKNKQAAGEKLEVTQIEKISKEESIKQEIRELEELISAMKIKR